MLTRLRHDFWNYPAPFPSHGMQYLLVYITTRYQKSGSDVSNTADILGPNDVCVIDQTVNISSALDAIGFLDCVHV
jgi:hypothetical protein